MYTGQFEGAWRNERRGVASSAALRHFASCVVNRRHLAALACAALALACSKAPEAVEKPKPQYGTWGFDLAGADTRTRPGDDFFRYANGHWLDTTQIPSDKP